MLFYLKRVVVVTLLLVSASAGCAPPKSQGVPNSALTVPDVPPAGSATKKGPLGGPPGRS
jgi:hypothetical protein